MYTPGTASNAFGVSKTRKVDWQTVKTVVAHAKKGHQIFFRRSHNGYTKIKVTHGPFGLLVSRYPTDSDTYEEIKNWLKNNSCIQ